jgi:hypothetical protein
MVEIKTQSQKFAQAGGKALFKKRGREYFSKLAKKRWKKTTKKKD